MDKRTEILKIIEKKKYGLSIEEISKALSINRITSAKYLAVLQAEKKIDVRVIGKYRLHYPRGVLK